MTTSVTQKEKLTTIERSILRTLLYFDIFNHPLTEQELHLFLDTQVTALAPSIQSLTEKNLLFNTDFYYTLHPNQQTITRRKRGSALADVKLKTAQRFSRLISWFPFVRAIMLSGSISKGYMDEKSDIDYFIVTKPGRLWLVRTSMAFFRRIFLFNSHKNFCTNYFVDEAALEIEEKNIFTAVEIVTLKPMFGSDVIHRFQKANEWCSNYFPNLVIQNGFDVEKENWLKKVTEKILSISWFDKLDNYLMNYSINRWNKIYSHYDQKDFNIAFQSTPHISRSHPEFYQKKVLNLYRQKIKEFEDRHQLDLSR